MSARTLVTRPTTGHATRRTGFFVRLAHLLAVHSSRTRLAMLDDHMLRDVGITREQAESELGRPLWDAPAGWRR